MNRADYHVLLVEDTSSSLELAILVLEQAGFSVDSAENGSEALDAAACGSYDAILLDLKLPDIDGLEVVRQLRAKPKTQGIPIVAVSAWALPGDSKHALSAGCDGYITKPIDVSRFAGQVEKYITSARESAAIALPDES